MMISQLRVSRKVIESKDIDLNQVILGKRPKPNCGYLLMQTDLDRVQEVYTVCLFTCSDGTILISDFEGMLTGNIKAHVKLNKHAVLRNVKVGQDDNDKKLKRFSAALTFRFNAVSFLLTHLDINI